MWCTTIAALYEIDITLPTCLIQCKEPGTRFKELNPKGNCFCDCIRFASLGNRLCIIDISVLELNRE